MTRIPRAHPIPLALLVLSLGAAGARASTVTAGTITGPTCLVAGGSAREYVATLAGTIRNADVGGCGSLGAPTFFVVETDGPLPPHILIRIRVEGACLPVGTDFTSRVRFQMEATPSSGLDPILSSIVVEEVVSEDGNEFLLPAATISRSSSDPETDHEIALAGSNLGHVEFLSITVKGAPSPGCSVKLKTDNGPDGYYYNAGGNAAARYVSRYRPDDILPSGIVCGVRYSDLDTSVRKGNDDYVLGLDLRSADPNFPEYADLTAPGLLASGDANSLQSCSSTGIARTATFGGGAGLPRPGSPFFITMPQPANNDPEHGFDMCGILLDTTSVFVNSARTQGYFPGGPRSSLGFNHFIEAVAYEPAATDLRLRMSGSSRFPGDRGLPVMFARRRCSGSDCRTDRTDTTGNDSTDDFISATVVVDRSLAEPPLPLLMRVKADRSALSPALSALDVTSLLHPIGGGPPATEPMVFPAGRTVLRLEMRQAIKRKILPLLPVDLPFSLRLIDPNDGASSVGDVVSTLGLRPSAGYLDGDRSDGFLVTRDPVLTGDALVVRVDAVDLPDPLETLRVTGAQVSGGEIGASGLPGLDAFQLRREDAILARNPDLSPQGLLRARGTVGDPGNADGIALGPPVTTLAIDLTDFVTVPGNPALAPTLFGLAYLNPGDSLGAATALAFSSAGEVTVGNSSRLLGDSHPVLPLTEGDLAIRLDVDGELGTASLRSRRTKLLTYAYSRPAGHFIAVDKDGRRVE
jgi:hypothetical protein